MIELKGIRAARPKVGEPPSAAILEDEHRQRVLILSRETDGRVSAQLLYDLDLEARLPQLQSCTRSRQCAIDRDPVMGGLGCVAVCVLDVLKAPP